VSNLLKKERGFTLIEIVLVLAIAGLILLMVFLAVSGAQKSRRDTQRKEDISRIVTQLESYASNDGGAYPTAAQLGAFETTYLSPQSDYEDPLSGAFYGGTMTYATTPGTTPGDIAYEVGYTCNGSTMAINNNLRSYALVMQLEQGTVCRTNQ
jgi:prepilin-type N-terminal cleavage/methylation domain-containing protein